MMRAIAKLSTVFVLACVSAACALTIAVHESDCAYAADRVGAIAEFASEAGLQPCANARAGETEGIAFEKADAQRLETQASKYTIATSHYKITVPKAWRGKVVWKTEYTEVRDYYGNSKGVRPTTRFYLKGHMGEWNYYLASVNFGTSSEPGPGLDVTNTMGLRLEQGDKRLYLVAPNWAYRIYYSHHSSTYKTGVSKKMEVKLLKLTTSGKVSYTQAKKKGTYAYGSANKVYNAPAKQMEKLFKKNVKLL